MKNQRVFCLFTCFLCLLFTLVNANAGNRAGAATLTLSGGYEFFTPKRHLDNTGVLLGILGYDFTARWGVEGLWGVFNTTAKPSQNNDNQHDGSLFAVDAVYHFVPYQQIIEPFLLAGVGATGIQSSGVDGNNEGNINAGIGAEVFLDPSIALRLDGRDLYTIVGGKNDVLLTAGITFLMGGCPPVSCSR